MTFFSGHAVRSIAVRSAVLIAIRELQFSEIRAAIPAAPERSVSYLNWRTTRCVLINFPEYPLATLQIGVFRIIFILIHTLVLHIVFKKTIHFVLLSAAPMIA